MAATGCAFAQQHTLAVSQYAHTSWSVRQGFTQDNISSIAQTPDGYLWLGTGRGLYRFDGVRNVLWKPINEQLRATDVLSLLATRDGSLWIGGTTSLSRWKNGSLEHHPEFDDVPVYALLESRDGTVWAGGGDGVGKLCSIRDGKTKCYGEDKSLGRWVSALHEDAAGNLWVAGMGLKGLWRWMPGPPVFLPLSGPQNITGLGDGEAGSLLVATTGSGIQQIVGASASRYELPQKSIAVSPRYFLRDKEGGLWIGTGGQGVVHVQNQREDVFTTTDGLSGGLVKAIFQDREGDIWVATIDGLDRFRHFAITTISTRQGLSATTGMALLAARDGSMWFATQDGLNHWQDGTNIIYRSPGKSSSAGSAAAGGPLSAYVQEVKNSGIPSSSGGALYEDSDGRIWESTTGGIAYFENGRFTKVPKLPGTFVSSITGDTQGNIWLADLNLGLVHLVNGKELERFSWDKLGHKDDATSLLVDPVRGGLWLGFSEGGVVYFADGKPQESYGAAEGLTGTVTSLAFGRAGALWASTDDGLVRIWQHHAATMTVKNGLPCNAAQEFAQAGESVWLYMACGLLRIPQSELDAWVSGKKQQVQFTAFDTADGVRTHANTSAYSPGIAKSTDGRIWFLPFDGVSVIDPAHLYANALPPPVYVEQVTADQQVYGASSDVSLPPLVRDLKIDYTALSLVAPERVFFRYMLEGYDRNWHDVGNLRQAFYNNLPPGSYKFRVIACNNSGVWNQAGAVLNFRIAPAYYQTDWFKFLCVAAILGLVWLVYALRLRSIENRYRERKMAEEALRKVEAELAHVSRVTTMGELTASLAHELNQPIAAAMLNANTCRRWLSREHPDMHEAQEAAARVVSDARRAAETITRVRLLFKKSAPQQELLDVNELVKEMLDLVGAAAKDSSVRVRSDLATDLPRVWSDRVQVQQVLMNLIMNSIDAMKNLETERDLWIETRRLPNDEVLVNVRDSGTGIPPDRIEEIFNAFYTTKSTGTGLGLRISRSIVELHGGKLWAANNNPRGAVFSFTLPVGSHASE